MPARRRYRLTATTGLDAGALCDFFELFKRRDINIQKLVLIQQPKQPGHPRSNGVYVSELDLLFLVPQHEPDIPPHPFIQELDTCLSRPEWFEKTINPL